MTMAPASQKSAAGGDADVHSLVDALASTPTEQLALVVTQHPTLALHTTYTLEQCARAVLNSKVPQSLKSAKHAGFQELPSTTSRTADALANILRRLIARGDPSLARRLVPTQASLIDLAVVTDARDIFARLVDVQQGAQNLVEAAYMVLMATSKADAVDAEKLARSAVILARVVASMPRRQHEAGTGTPKRGLGQGKLKANVKGGDAASDEVAFYISIVASLCLVYGRLNALQASQDGKSALAVMSSKICLLDAAWAVLERTLALIAPAGSPAHSASLEPLWSALDLGAAPAAYTGLVDAPLAYDLAQARPLINILRATCRAPRIPVLDNFEKSTRAGAARNNGNAPDGWTILKAELAASDANETVAHSSDDVLEAVLAVLPHLGTDRDRLRKRLSRPPLAGKSAEEAISLLLDIPDIGDASTSEPAPELDKNDDDDDDALAILRARANVFDEESLEQARIVKGKNKESAKGQIDVLGTGLSEELRIKILQQAEQPDSDEEAREEWDPFYSTSRMQLDLDDDDLEGVDEGYTPAGHAAGRREHTGSGTSEGEEGESVHSHRGSSHGTPRFKGTESRGRADSPDPQSAASRAAERILTATMKHEGEQVFSKAARGSNGRKQLLEALKGVPGSNKWDDQLVESWATMFARNPRRDKLLAAVDDILRLGNPNAASTTASDALEDGDPSRSRFGPNRGRGGRILQAPMGESGRGRGGGRGNGRGRGASHSSRGSGRGGQQRGGAKRGQSNRGRGN